MRVSVEIPEPKSNGLDTALAKQFADIQRQLLGFVRSQREQQDDTREDLLKAMRQQQESLVSALTSLVGMMNQSMNSSKPSDAMLSAVQGLKRVVSELPGDLKEALDQQYQAIQDRTVKVSVRPQVNVSMPKGFSDRIDALESALLQGLHRSRSRTFGSNF